MGYQYADGTEAIAPIAYHNIPYFTKSLDIAMLLVTALEGHGKWLNLDIAGRRDEDSDYPGGRWCVASFYPDEWAEFSWSDDAPAKAVVVAAILAAGGNPFVEEEAQS